MLKHCTSQRDAMSLFLVLSISFKPRSLRLVWTLSSMSFRSWSLFTLISLKTTSFQLSICCRCPSGAQDWLWLNTALCPWTPLRILQSTYEYYWLDAKVFLALRTYSHAVILQFTKVWSLVSLYFEQKLQIEANHHPFSLRVSHVAILPLMSL